MKPVKNQELEDHVKAVETDPKINLKVPVELKNPHPIVKGLQMHNSKSWSYNEGKKAFPQGNISSDST